MQLAHNSILIGSVMQSNACSLSKNLAIIPNKNNSIIDELGTIKE
jgi:hypothetical protein